MVKPGNNSPQSPKSNGPSSASGPPPESGDFSFIVLDRSMPDSQSGAWNQTQLGLPSFNGASNSNNLSTSMQQNTSSMQSTFPDLSPEEVQKKLQDLLRENVELKETLQQNNLAMKQQFATLVTWQEDVVRVQQNHKEKFEETRSLITKLKMENANLSLTVQNQPDVSKMLSENEDLKLKVEILEKKLVQQERLIEENTSLQAQVALLEHKLKAGVTASEAQMRAERRVCEMTEEKQQLLRMNDELTQRVALLQTELATVQAESFVVVEHAVQKQAAVPKPELAKQAGVASSPDGIAMFCQALDCYDEKLMVSYQRLEQQVDSFSHLYGWLQRVSDSLPNHPDIAPLQVMLLEMSNKIRDTQGTVQAHRVKLDESRQQLGRLGSEFQELLQDWVQFNKQRKDIQDNNSSYQEIQAQGFKEQIDRLTAQLMQTEEKLAHKEATMSRPTVVCDRDESKSLHETQKLREKVDHLSTELLATREKLLESRANVARQEGLLAQSEAALASQHNAQQSQGLRDEIDKLTAQLLASQDKVSQYEAKLTQHATWLADRDSALAQLNVKVSQQDAKLAQKETELQQAERKLKALEQNIDALSAQAEVYKMDFNEERESRQKLAADKEKVADDLRMLQRRNEQLLHQLEESERQLAQAQQSAPVPSGARPTSYNTIATPGRVRNQWPPAPEQPQLAAETAPKYECPICQLRFRTLQPLENHLDVCMDRDMYP